MITEKQIFDVLNKYQSTGCILPNEKCIDPMDFHKIVNEIILLINTPVPSVAISSDCGYFRICTNARKNCHLNCGSYCKSQFTYTK